MTFSKSIYVVALLSILSLGFIQVPAAAAKELSTTQQMEVEQRESLLNSLKQLLAVYQQMLQEIQAQERSADNIEHFKSSKPLTVTADGSESITVNKDTLRTSSHHPILTGSATGLYSVELIIRDSNDRLVGGWGGTSVNNGKWSMGPIATTLEKGRYTLEIKGRLASNDFNEKTYATETLVITD